MDHVVVVGASLAGLRAADAVRAAGHHGKLTLVGVEVHHPYNRPPLSKHVLAGAMEPERTTLRHAVEVDWRLGVAATGLDASAHEVRLADGTTLRYDGLVVATGCAARPWPAPLAVTEGVFLLRTLDDALALRESVLHHGAVVIVGAGFIGCEVAATLRGLDIAVTLVDVAPHPMLPLREEIGQLMTEVHREHGVDVRLGVGVDAFEERGGRLEAVRLTDGTRVTAGAALLALGAVPATSWLRGSGLTLAPGVVCDATCFAVGVADVVCAGDVAHWPHPLAGGELVHVEHWGNAVAMGQSAGRNLVVAHEERRPYLELPAFWTDQYDLRIQSVGFLHLADRLEVVEGSVAERRFVAVGHHEERLVAAVAVNDARRLAHYRALIQSQAGSAAALPIART